MFFRQHKTLWYQFCNFKHFLKAENSEDSLASSCVELIIGLSCNPVWDWVTVGTTPTSGIQTHAPITVSSTSFSLEPYLTKLHRKDYISLCKFRSGCSKIPIVTGRYQDIDRENRICTLCNEDIGDEYRVFSLKFWWGGDSKFSVPDGDEVGWGGTCEKILTEAKTAHFMQNEAIFCYFKHEIQLFKVLLSLRGYCTSEPYFWRLCAFSQKIKQFRTKYPMDLVRNVPRNSKITVLLQ